MMKRERKRKGIERLIVWIAAAVMTAGLVVMNFLISEGIKNEAESLPEGVLLQLKEPLETAEMKRQRYRDTESKMWAQESMEGKSMRSGVRKKERF